MAPKRATIRLLATVGLSCIVLVILNQRCGPFSKKPYLAQKSPDDQYCATIQDYIPFFSLDRQFVLEIEGERHITLPTAKTHDWLTGFADIIWSDDSRYVGFLLSNAYGGDVRIETAFDTREWHEIPFEKIAIIVAQRIRRSYAKVLSPNEPVLFQVRHPTNELRFELDRRQPYLVNCQKAERYRSATKDPRNSREQ